MTARNDVTGDLLQTKSNTEAYRQGWERIFGKKKTESIEENKKQAEEKECGTSDSSSAFASSLQR